MSAQRTVLLVDSELRMLHALARTLKETFAVETACDLEGAVAGMRTGILAAVVADLYLDGGPDGVAVLEAARDLQPQAQRVLMSSAPQDEHVANALHTGLAFCFVAKPFWHAEILAVLSSKVLDPTAADR